MLCQRGRGVLNIRTLLACSWPGQRVRRKPRAGRNACYGRRGNTTTVSYTHLTLPTICSV
eukprot:8817432-Alexandrium_andersonii.AAC.1